MPDPEKRPPVARIGLVVVVRAAFGGGRIAATTGELTAFVVVRAFGNMMISPLIRVSRNLTCPIQLGVFGVQVILTISDWIYGCGTIDFMLRSRS